MLKDVSLSGTTFYAVPDVRHWYTLPFQPHRPRGGGVNWVARAGERRVYSWLATSPGAICRRHHHRLLTPRPCSRASAADVSRVSMSGKKTASCMRLGWIIIFCSFRVCTLRRWFVAISTCTVTPANKAWLCWLICAFFCFSFCFSFVFCFLSCCLLLNRDFR